MSAPIACGDPPFRLGVASGDPTPDGVVLWTRLTLPGARSYCEVFWEVAMDDRFRSKVASGFAVAAPERQHVVRVEVQGLCHGVVYWYRFRFGGQFSTVGVTRTAPAPIGFQEATCFALVPPSLERLTTPETAAELLRHDLDFVAEAPPHGPAWWNGSDLGDEDAIERLRARFERAYSHPRVQQARAAAPWLELAVPPGAPLPEGQTPRSMQLWQSMRGEYLPTRSRKAKQSRGPLAHSVAGIVRLRAGAGVVPLKPRARHLRAQVAWGLDVHAAGLTIVSGTTSRTAHFGVCWKEVDLLLCHFDFDACELQCIADASPFRRIRTTHETLENVHEPRLRLAQPHRPSQ